MDEWFPDDGQEKSNLSPASDVAEVSNQHTENQKTICCERADVNQRFNNEPHIRCRESTEQRQTSFLKYVATARGPKQVIIVLLFLALSQGSTVGVIPALLTDRYARITYEYHGPPCFSFEANDIFPEECKNGAFLAQKGAAASSFARSILAFLSSSLMGSISDKKGRRGILIVSMTLASLPPLSMVLVNGIEGSSPALFYASDAIRGLVYGTPIFLSSISDVIPPKWKAGSFGAVTAVFALGYAFAPLFAVKATHESVCVVSLTLVLCGLVLTIIFVPETLPSSLLDQETSRTAQLYRKAWWKVIVSSLARPLKELAIAKRNRLFILLSCLTLFAGMILSADATFTVYYIENELKFNDRDISIFFIVLGVTSIVVQGFVLKPLTAWIGEKLVLVVAFVLSALHSFLYGLAKTKQGIFVAAAAAGVAGMALPTLGAVFANNVDASEQGRVQGATYSLSSLAQGLGPVFLQLVYNYVKDTDYPGPGGMFLAAGLLQVGSIFISCMLPEEQTNFSNSSRARQITSEGDLTDSLIEDRKDPASAPPSLQP